MKIKHFSAFLFDFSSFYSNFHPYLYGLSASRSGGLSHWAYLSAKAVGRVDGSKMCWSTSIELLKAFRMFASFKVAGIWGFSLVFYEFLKKFAVLIMNWTKFTHFDPYLCPTRALLHVIGRFSAVECWICDKWPWRRDKSHQICFRRVCWKESVIFSNFQLKLMFLINLSSFFYVFLKVGWIFCVFSPQWAQLPNQIGYCPVGNTLKLISSNRRRNCASTDVYRWYCTFCQRHCWKIWDFCWKLVKKNKERQEVLWKQGEIRLETIFFQWKLKRNWWKQEKKRYWQRWRKKNWKNVDETKKQSVNKSKLRKKNHKNNKNENLRNFLGKI